MKTIIEVINEFNNLPKAKQVAVLWEALDIMQAYNGRTRHKCVAIAMYYKVEYDDNGKEYYIK